MKQPLAVTLLVLASVISSSAIAQQSTLRPLDASAASLISGGAAPASSQSTSGYSPPSSGGLSPMSDTSATAAPAPMVQMPAAGPRVPASSMLPAGTRLSVALDRYVRERGWDLRWQIDEDYVLDANLPIPSGDLIEGVTWVVHTYQSQGGMYGVVPRFARSNHVVVIEKMDVRENY